MSVMFRSRLSTTSICLRPTVLRPIIMPSSKRNPTTQTTTAALSTSLPKREDAFHELKKQGYHRSSSDNEWIQSTDGKPLPKYELQPPLHPGKIRVISWNVDAFSHSKDKRMKAALDYLQILVSCTAPELAVVIFFQEMGAPHLEQLRESAWVKQRFNLTDVSQQHWLSFGYGTTTLVDQRLQIDSVFRIPWHSQMGRDGLFVDISLDNRIDPDAPHRIMRLCNTHLESLRADPPVRPVQMAAARKYLSQDEVSCAILAGDLNAIQRFDYNLHTDNKLNDAYLEIGGKEGTPGKEASKEGHTWGYQGRSTRFGYHRLDKILYRGSLSPIEFQRIGMGIRVTKEHEQTVEKVASMDWVSDHYGVMCDFTLSSDELLTDKTAA